VSCLAEVVWLSSCLCSLLVPETGWDPHEDISIDVLGSRIVIWSVNLLCHSSVLTKARAGQKTSNPDSEYPNPNPKYPKPEFCSGISGSNLQNPNLFRVIRVSQSGTRNTRITRTFMCHVFMSCLIINLYIYNYV
jgi:hypothetical protein